jgi:cytochrome c5
MNKTIVFMILALAAVALIQFPAPIVQADETSSVHSITLPVVPVELKDGVGKDKVMAFCSICHSPDYIPMQPLLPAKTWDAVVHKMIKVFGAPVGEDDAKIIIDYLSAQYSSEK